MSEDRGTESADDEWAISLEDLEEGESARPQPAPIEPGDPTVEGVAFVVLGVALTLVVLLGGL
ncbi:MULTISPECIES: DUF7312 domain-containing protein [Halolamina]|uniref:DUF7312 domain-containing protein n=1 Tax=Halolamina pelagica TaxID=699431 RepID=A0A1I5SC33_9EURY|nr:MULTISPECIES: hypothetical protein [Halolamina]NHX37127.1 hypothetical protein [Halolamina sp. R1-12]SFP68279.1 hypothetical protein SAMN05216277_10649 [Halolamina pelagica]